MCALGHHDHDVDIRPGRAPRRHLDGSVTQAVKRMSRKAVEDAKVRMTAALRAELDTAEADALAAGHGYSLQLEPADPVTIARDARLVSIHQPGSHSMSSRALPPPEALYYSAAREA